MVSPVMAAMGIQMGSSLIGGNMARKDANNAYQYNLIADQYNRERADAEAMRGRNASDRMLGMQLEGSTDERGNRTKYVPGQGWVVDNSAQSQALIDATDRELLTRSTEDTARERRGAVREEGRANAEQSLADAMMQRMKQGDYSKGLDEYQNEEYANLAQAMNEANSGQDESLATALIRQGATGSAAPILDNIQKSRQNALTGGIREALMAGKQRQQAEKDSTLRSLQPTYTSLTTRTNPQAGFAPVGSTFNQNTAAGVDGRQYVSAQSAAGGRYNGINPNTADARFVQGAGNQISSAIERQFRGNSF
jgi:hypothetical protein